MKARLALVALCAAVLLVPSAGAATRTGKVVKVVDGETVRIKVKKRTVTVFLAGGCPEVTAKLRSLLPRGAKVRIRGSYVYRGSRQINRSLRAACRALDEPQPQPQPQPPAPTPTPAPAAGPDTAENRTAFDKVLRGFKFVVRDSQSGGSFTFTQDRAFHWCSNGSFIFERIYNDNTGVQEYEREDGTWKVSNVTRREGQAIEGNIEVSSAKQGQPQTTGFFYGGLTSDGTGFMRISDNDRLASRVATDMC